MLGILGGVLAFITSILEFIRDRARASKRANLVCDLSILEELEDSETKTKFQEHIDRQVEALISDSEKRRDWLGVVLGVSFMVAAAGLSAFAFMRESDWWMLLFIPAGVLGIFGLVGFAQSVTPREPKTSEQSDS